jgi:hypothetical protein
LRKRISLHGPALLGVTAAMQAMDLIGFGSRKARIRGEDWAGAQQSKQGRHWKEIEARIHHALISDDQPKVKE